MAAQQQAKIIAADANRRAAEPAHGRRIDRLIALRTTQNTLVLEPPTCSSQQRLAEWKTGKSDRAGESLSFLNAPIARILLTNVPSPRKSTIELSYSVNPVVHFYACAGLAFTSSLVNQS